MVLRNLDLQPDYRSGRDVLLDDFYVPCLQESVLYYRAVGFFSSTLFDVVHWPTPTSFAWWSAPTDLLTSAQARRLRRNEGS